MWAVLLACSVRNAPVGVEEGPVVARKAPAECATRVTVATTERCPGDEVVWSEGLVAGLDASAAQGLAAGSACRLACGGGYATWMWVFDLEPTLYEGAVRCRVDPEVEQVVELRSQVASRGAEVTWHAPVPGWHHTPGTFLLTVDMTTGEATPLDRSLGVSCEVTDGP